MRALVARSGFLFAILIVGFGLAALGAPAYAQQDAKHKSRLLSANLFAREIAQTAGETYHVAVDGVGGANGPILLNWDFVVGSTPTGDITVSPETGFTSEGPIGDHCTGNMLLFGCVPATA